MGTFNFSNMQGGQQQETQNIPREFRPAVEQAKTEPVGSYGNNKTGFWDEVKNFSPVLMLIPVPALLMKQEHGTMALNRSLLNTILHKRVRKNSKRTD